MMHPQGSTQTVDPIHISPTRADTSTGQHIVSHEVIVRRCIDAFNAGQWQPLVNCFAPHFVNHTTPRYGARTNDLGTLSRQLQGIRAAFRDLHITIDDLLSDQERVAVRWTAHGTHAGEFAGVAASGACLSWSGMAMVTIDGGKITDLWLAADTYPSRLAIGQLSSSDTTDALADRRAPAHIVREG